MRALVISCTAPGSTAIASDEVLATELAAHDVDFLGVSLLTDQEAAQFRLDADFMAERMHGVIASAPADIPLGLIGYGTTVHPGLTALPQGHFSISGISIGHVNLIIFAAALGFALLFFLFFKYTRLGLQTRALTENLEGAAAMGVNTDVIYAVAWASAALLAGSAGVFYSNSIAIIDLSLPAIGLRAFPAAIIGGLDSMKGALVGGLLVGVIEQLAVGYLGAEWQDVAAYGTMFVVLMIRPYGLFGSPEIVRV